MKERILIAIAEWWRRLEVQAIMRNLNELLGLITVITTILQVGLVLYFAIIGLAPFVGSKLIASLIILFPAPILGIAGIFLLFRVEDILYRFKMKAGNYLTRMRFRE